MPDLSLAKPVSEENAFKDLKVLRMGGKRLLVAAGILALAFLVAIIYIVSSSGRSTSLMFIIGDYVVTLGIAVPGLILYILRLYTDKSIRRGNPKAFSRTAKLGFVSISWVALAVVVVYLLVQPVA
jgi:hypothetical protein